MSESLRERIARAIKSRWDEGYSRFWQEAVGIDPPHQTTFDDEREIFEGLAFAALAAIESSGTHVVAEAALIEAARKCDHWMTQAEDSLGPPQAAAWREFHKAFDVLRAALPARPKP